MIIGSTQSTLLSVLDEGVGASAGKWFNYREPEGCVGPSWAWCWHFVNVMLCFGLCFQIMPQHGLLAGLSSRWRSRVWCQSTQRPSAMNGDVWVAKTCLTWEFKVNYSVSGHVMKIPQKQRLQTDVLGKKLQFHPYSREGWQEGTIFPLQAAWWEQHNGMGLVTQTPTLSLALHPAPPGRLQFVPGTLQFFLHPCRMGSSRGTRGARPEGCCLDARSEQLSAPWWAFHYWSPAAILMAAESLCKLQYRSVPSMGSGVN